MPIHAVIEKLNELNDLHQTLHQLGMQKKDVLISNQVNELAALVNQENKLLKQVVEAEGQWRSAIASFLQSKGVRPTPSITVSDIIGHIDNPAGRQAVEQAQTRLLHTIDQLKVINEQNQKLIEQSLSFIDYSLDLFMGDSGQEVVYRKPQSGAYGQQRRGLFDTRA